jgi:segregation and condensation protein A
MTLPYRVQIDVFEGPLDLLLHLIKKNEVAITDVPTAIIIEQYMEYLEMMEKLSLDIAGEFLVMAATLLLIKSRTLLPVEEEEEEPEPDDPRVELMRQLMEYQRYREAALSLGERPLLNRDVFAREPLKRVDPADPSVQPPDGGPPLKVSVWQLLDAMRRIIERTKPEPVHEVHSEPVSLRDRTRFLLRRLGENRSLGFEELFAADRTRLQIVVTFLAVLELMKMGAIAVVQEVPFGPILINLAVADVADVRLDGMDEYDSAPTQVAAVEVPQVDAPHAEGEAGNV